LTAISSEDLEIERNDVRDLLRSVASSEHGGSTSNVNQLPPPLQTTLEVLSRILHACGDAILTARRQRQLFPETSIHALSALAKPLNHLARAFTKSSNTKQNRETLLFALHILTTSGEILVDAFQRSTPLQLLFPLSRTTNIAMASLSPMLSELSRDEIADFEFLEAVGGAVKVSVHTCTLAIASMSELAAPSQLDHTQYDIRGAFRSPGGEDHVSCIALTRLAFESDDLAKVLVKSSSQFISQLLQLHQHLKILEADRVQGDLRGKGMTPKSRRLLLGVLCRLEFVSEGRGGMSEILTGIFDRAIEAISSFNGQELCDGRAFFELCETTFDIAAFPTSVVTHLFDPESGGPHRTRCLETLTDVCVQGYHSFSTTNGHNDATLQVGATPNFRNNIAVFSHPS